MRPEGRPRRAGNLLGLHTYVDKYSILCRLRLRKKLTVLHVQMSETTDWKTQYSQLIDLTFFSLEIFKSDAGHSVLAEETQSVVLYLYTLTRSEHVTRTGGDPDPRVHLKFRGEIRYGHEIDF